MKKKPFFFLSPDKTMMVDDDIIVRKISDTLAFCCCCCKVQTKQQHQQTTNNCHRSRRSLETTTDDGRINNNFSQVPSHLTINESSFKGVSSPRLRLVIWWINMSLFALQLAFFSLFLFILIATGTRAKVAKVDSLRPQPKFFFFSFF